MNRREFLKLSALFSTSFFLPASITGIFKLPVETTYRGKIYRGTADGKVFISEDDRKSWRLHYNLGAQYSITDISAGLDGQIYLKVGYQYRSFQLKLAQNEKFWESVPEATSMLLNLV
jgi:hypothetical protein